MNMLEWAKKEVELVIEAFETLEERNKEFDRVVNLLNAK